MGLFRAPPPGRRATPGRVGRVGGGTSIQLPSPSGARYLSLSLSLVVVVVVVERELYQTTPYSLCLCLCLSLCVCVSYLPCPRPSWPRPSTTSNSPLLSCPPPARVSFCLLRSVFFFVFSVYEFTPFFGNLSGSFPLIIFRFSRRVGAPIRDKASRGGRRGRRGRHHGVLGEDAGKACARWKQNEWCQQGNRVGKRISSRKGKKKKQQTTLSGDPGHTHHKNN